MAAVVLCARRPLEVLALAREQWVARMARVHCRNTRRDQVLPPHRLLGLSHKQRTLLRVTVA